VIGNAEFERAVMGAFNVRPTHIALEPDDKTASKLIVATSLYAAKSAIHIVLAERPAEKGSPGSANNPFLRLGPKAVCMTAEIAAAPTPNREERP
jgi:hypothetical protein